MPSPEAEIDDREPEVEEGVELSTWRLYAECTRQGYQKPVQVCDKWGPPHMTVHKVTLQVSSRRGELIYEESGRKTTVSKAKNLAAWRILNKMRGPVLQEN